MIKAKCSNCDKSFNAPEEYAGKKVKCPNCKIAFEIPALGQTTASMDPNTNLEKQKKQVEMPQEVKTALLLLWISLGIGILNSLVVGASGSFELTIVVGVTVLFMAFLIHRIKKGENWARLIFLILFVIGVIFSIPSLLSLLSANPIGGLLSWTVAVLQVIAIIFLFLKPSSDWFGRLQNQENKPLLNRKTVLKVAGGFFLLFFVLGIVYGNKVTMDGNGFLFLFLFLIIVFTVGLISLYCRSMKKHWRKLGRLFGRMKSIYSTARKSEITKLEVEEFFDCADEAYEMMSKEPFVNDTIDVPRIKEEIDRMSNQVSLFVANRKPNTSQGKEIERLSVLRREGLISEAEFKAFSERFMVTTGEKARGIIKAISDLSEQRKKGAMMDGNYNAALWTLLDKLDRKID